MSFQTMSGLRADKGYSKLILCFSIVLKIYLYDTVSSLWVQNYIIF